MLRPDIRTYVRTMLGEPTASFWTDAELNTWINFAQNDIARLTKFNDKKGYGGYISAYTASKTLTTVTKTVGTDFAAGDVGKFIVWADNTADEIVTYTDATHVVVDNSGTQASQSAGKYSGTIVDQAEYALPSDCFILKEVLLDDSPINYVPWEDYLSLVNDGDDTGLTWYSIGRHDSKIYMYPTPTSVGINIVLYYYGTTTDLSADSGAAGTSAITDSFRELIPLYVLWKAWEKDEDFNKAKDYERQYKSMLKDFIKKCRFPYDILNVRIRDIREVSGNNLEYYKTR